MNKMLLSKMFLASLIVGTTFISDAVAVKTKIEGNLKCNSVWRAAALAAEADAATEAFAEALAKSEEAEVIAAAEAEAIVAEVTAVQAAEEAAENEYWKDIYLAELAEAAEEADIAAAEAIERTIEEEAQIVMATEAEENEHWADEAHMAEYKDWGDEGFTAAENSAYWAALGLVSYVKEVGLAACHAEFGPTAYEEALKLLIARNVSEDDFEWRTALKALNKKKRGYD